MKNIVIPFAAAATLLFQSLTIAAPNLHSTATTSVAAQSPTSGPVDARGRYWRHRR
jgi:hypothetical protein